MFEIVDHHVKKYFVCFQFLTELLVLTIQAFVLNADFLYKLLYHDVYFRFWIYYFFFFFQQIFNKF